MATPDTVAAVRRFNRFYTRAIGVLDKGHLGGPYTLAESRVLYEIASREGVTPKDIINATGLDAGYLSRIVKRFEREGLVSRAPSPDDGRSVVLSVTPGGRETYAGLHGRTLAQVEGLVGGLSAADQGRLVQALAEAERLLAAPPPSAAYALRPLRVGDIGWVVQRHGVVYAREYGWDERFEAMCAQIAGDFVTHFDPARERAWIAERDGENVGCVFVAKGDETTAKLRLLLVEPGARGLGLGRRLVDECTGFARAAGYRTMTLWTQSVLTAARRLYAAAGFRIVDTWPNRDFGGWGLTSERWDLDL
ncbi:MAG: bifunctional helix-turn-helix transcriptional regulator/GNAT family N-acetyltransferase [Pseudomonadota bacterium]